MRTYNADKAREKRMRIAAEQGRVFVKKVQTGLCISDPTRWRREYKCMKRRQAGAQLRTDIAANAQAKRQAKERAADSARLRRPTVPLHDAHVKRFVYILEARTKYAKRYKSDPQTEIDRQKRRKQALPDSYVIQNLKATGIPIDAITPDLIAIKREAMQYGRMSRTIKTTVKNHLKEDHETVTKHA